MGAAGIVALVHFVKHLGADSALAAAYGAVDAHDWTTTLKTNVLLADVYDALTWFNYTYVASGSKHKPKKPKPYPRPWVKGEVQKFGREPIPIKDFDNWWKEQAHG